MTIVKHRRQTSPCNDPGLGPAQPIASELAKAEAKLLSLLDSREELIGEICRYLVSAGGKRLRPTFVLLVYRACGGRESRLDDAIDAAIAMELIHSATLLHDDIIDTGTLRRGKPSAFALWGLAPSLVAGDYLFARAFELCGRFEEPLVKIAAEACIQLTEGEVMEGRLRRNSRVTLDDYMGVISRKTASLFRAGAKVGALLAGAHDATAATMARLGDAVGLAFQMIDDLLDVLGPEEKIGKPVGADLRAGVPSLPLVLGVEKYPALESLLLNGAQVDPAALERALELLRSADVVGRARNLALEQIAIAHQMLEVLKPSPFKDALARLINEQVYREV